MAGDPLSDLRAAVGAAVACDRRRNQPVKPAIERPKRAEQGDYSTNAAMLLAPGLGEKPRDIAERLAGDLESRLGAGLDRLEVAGPGFVNLFLSDALAPQRRRIGA